MNPQLIMTIAQVIQQILLMINQLTPHDDNKALELHAELATAIEQSSTKEA